MKALIWVFLKFERVKGIEPSSSGWKPDVIAIIQHPPIQTFRAAGNRTQSTCSQSTRTAGIRQPDILPHTS
jgi:hypothetical protein